MVRNSVHVSHPRCLPLSFLGCLLFTLVVCVFGEPRAPSNRSPQRAKRAFVMYDVNDDGFIDEAEMVNYLESVFRIMLSSSQTEADVTPRVRLPSAFHVVIHADLLALVCANVFPFTPVTFRTTPIRVLPFRLCLLPSRNHAVWCFEQALAEATASQLFEDADTDSDGRLSFDEFVRWYISANEGDAGVKALVVPSAQQASGAQSTGAVDESLTPESFAQLSGLVLQPVMTVFKEFAAKCDSQGCLSHSAFRETFETFSGKLRYGTRTEWF